MSLLEIGHILFGRQEGLIDYLRRNHLLADHCQLLTVWHSYVSDGFSWWCHQCKTRKGIRDHSFFTKSRITQQKWVLLVYCWAGNYSLTDAAEESQIDAGTAVDIFQWFQDVCSTKHLQTPIILGRQGIVVEIIESLFCHKPKVHFCMHPPTHTHTHTP